MAALWLPLVLLQLVVSITEGALVTIDNTKPRLDIHGNIIDAHDGTIQKFDHLGDELYYYHAVSYGSCKEPNGYGCDRTDLQCGFRNDHNVTVWTSPTLESGTWSLRSIAIAMDQRPPGIVFRPHCYYNPNTKLFVLFMNIVQDLSYNGYAVATSKSPLGPFTVVNTEMNITRLRGGAGDFDVLVDPIPNQHGIHESWIAYSAAFWVSMEKLTPDWRYSTGENATADEGSANPALFPEYFSEAPSFFYRPQPTILDDDDAYDIDALPLNHRKGINGDGVPLMYYLVFGRCCCFCMQGSGMLVHRARHPRGPWRSSPVDIGCEKISPLTKYPRHSPASHYNGVPTPNQGCQYYDRNTTSIMKAQLNHIIKVTAPDGTVTHVWTGDRWQQAPDGIKGHDPQYWMPLSFDDWGYIQQPTWLDTFDLHV